MSANAQHHEDILVVDDTPANLDLLLSMLTERGYRIRPAPSGELALRSAFAKPPDLVLLDVNMPGMDGYEVCERLQANDATRHVPVIFLSALDEVLDKVRAFNIGAVDYISKPFHVEEVVARIETQLTLYRQRVEIEQLREKERAHFEEVNRLKDQYVQMVSHDLKTPLSVIVGHASLIEKRGKLNDEADTESLEGIMEAAETMRRLIRDLLDLAKIESGVGMQMGSVSVNDLLSACTMAFGYNLEEKRLSLKLTPLEVDATIAADHDRMVQVLSNLLSNAVKYTPGGGEVIVSACRSDDSEMLYLEVKDTGMGIPPDDLPHIFDRFYRVQRATEQDLPGTGLGLSITKAIVEQHGGTIDAESRLNEGTRFMITLPLLSEPAPTA